MRWTVRHGDILDEPAELLICSANVFLNLSGGVGGALLVRYGPAMQHELHGHLKEHRMRWVSRGAIVACSPCGTPYKAVLHAVAVDGFYESAPEVITDIVARSLQMAAAFEARRVALAALATGYGHLSIAEFGRGLVPIVERAFPPIEEVIIVIRNEDEVTKLSGILLTARI